MLVELITQGKWQQVLVFCRTKHGANRLAQFLKQSRNHRCRNSWEQKSGARTRALSEFKTGEIRVLVATDIAARGIDIPQLPQVVNFDLPNVAEDYVHRIGRTGRAGEVGKAFSLVEVDEASDLFGIERLIQKVLPRYTLEGFQPTKALPESKLDTRPIKPKKPKKPKSSNAEQQNNPHETTGKATQAKNKRHFGTKNSARRPNQKRRFNKESAETT